MSKDSIFDNLYRVASSVFTQFNSDESLISEETNEILNDKEGRIQLYDKIIKNPQQGEVTLSVKGKDVTFFVEA